MISGRSSSSSFAVISMSAGPMGILAHLPRLVEGHVEEARLLRLQLECLDRRDGLDLADAPLEHEHGVAVHFTRLLLLQERLGLTQQRGQTLVAVAEVPGGTAQEVEVPAHLVVEHGDVAGRLVGDDDLILVLVQLAQDAARGDDVVVGVR
jgi:hypothetical protein